MSHWSEFLSAAIVHAECIRQCPIQIDVMQLMAAMAQARQQAMQQQGIIQGPFDPRLIKSAG